MSAHLKVLTYNIHKGFSARNRHYVLSHIRDALRDIHADLVALQEVIGTHAGHARARDDWHHEAHFEYLADQVWPHFAYGKNAIYQHGHHGNALLSKHPFATLRNRDISQSSYSRRSILHGTLHLPGSRSGGELELHVACVHLGFMPYEQYRQLELLGAWLKSLPAQAPVILMGDFNDWHQRIHRRLQRQHGLQEAGTHGHGRLPATYPASRPLLPMDRIYFRGLQLHHSRVCRGEHWRALSDHCPVEAEFVY